MDIAPHNPIRLDDFWGYQIAVLADRVSRYTLDIVKSEAGLNQSQWRVLAAIADEPGRTSADVTAVTPMDKTLVSRAVATLLRSGLIKRTPNLNDKRSAALEMTALGTERYALISAKLSETLNASVIDGQSTEAFNDAVKHFTAYMTQLTENPNFKSQSLKK